MAPDPLDEVFTLEDRFFIQGYNAGQTDGIPAGRAEGRSLGMQKGFEKFSESSRLASRAIIWANRETKPRDAPMEERCKLPSLQWHKGTGNAGGGARLRNNVRGVYALVEPGTLGMRNEDAEVQDFDDRLRRAQGKVKLIERMMGVEAGSVVKSEAQAGESYGTSSRTPGLST